MSDAEPAGGPDGAAPHLTVFASPFRDAAESLALEEILLAGQGCWFFLRRNDPCVSIGCNQDIECEIDIERVRASGVEVVRRATGGGAVYRDGGCISYSFILPANLKEQAVDLVVEALARLGIAVERSGRNDLFFNGRKISGFAWTERDGRVLVHGTVLFSTDIEAMDRLLGGRKAKYAGTAIESVKARVANVESVLPGLSADGFQAKLQDALLACMSARGWTGDFGTIDASVLAQAKAEALRYRIAL